VKFKSGFINFNFKNYAPHSTLGNLGIRSTSQSSEKTENVEDFSEEENHLLNASLQILHLIEKENGQRRSINGLNRIAQNRHPEISWKKVGVAQIASAWEIAGMSSLIDAIREARKLPAFCGKIATITPKLIESAAVEIEATGVDEAFVSIDAHLKSEESTQVETRLYRVAAKTNYGNYLFHLSGFIPPSRMAIERLCIAHNDFYSAMKNSKVDAQI
jgi:hypothetical protein